MTVKRILGLRNNMHRVDLVQLNGSTRPVLGRSHPQDDDNQRRARTQQQWDHHAPSPRAQRLASIAEPLPQRSQTILYYQVGAEIRQRLNEGSKPAASRQADGESAQADLPPPELDI